MPAPNFAKLLKGKKSKHYQNELATAALLQAVVLAKRDKKLSGDDIWQLLRLTWFTKTKRNDHWRGLKAPALVHLFSKNKSPKKFSKKTSLSGVLGSIPLPKTVAEMAANNTGCIGLYRAYRKSLQPWCNQNATELREIIGQAKDLPVNDQERWALAIRIDRLPNVPTPNGKKHKKAGDIVTPLVAFLDPHRRFPIINGNKTVQTLLRKLGIRGRNLKEQIRGMVGLIGPSGISDAFMLDVFADEIEEIAPKLNVPLKVRIVSPAPARLGSDLHELDASERAYFHQVGTVRYRQRHNKMTNALMHLMHKFKLRPGPNPDCRWDILVEHYDSTGRDLLLEAKPDAEKAALRIAIGQLLDYRRFVPRPAITDLAVLTIGAPDKLYRQLLLDLQISPIWFTNETCCTLSGEGTFWRALQESLRQPHSINT